MACKTAQHDKCGATSATNTKRQGERDAILENVVVCWIGKVFSSERWRRRCCCVWLYIACVRARPEWEYIHTSYTRCGGVRSHAECTLIAYTAAPHKIYSTHIASLLDNAVGQPNHSTCIVVRAIFLYTSTTEHIVTCRLTCAQREVLRICGLRV